MAYTTPSTYPVGTLIGTTEWDRDVVNNIIMLAEGPWTVRTGAVQAIATGSYQRVSFDTAVDGSTRTGLTITYSTTTDLFTLPVTGRYQVLASMAWGTSTASTAGNFRSMNIATSTASGGGMPVAQSDLSPANSTLEELACSLAGEVLITSTTKFISCKAFQDSGANLNVLGHSTGKVKRISIRWVGPV